MWIVQMYSIVENFLTGKCIMNYWDLYFNSELRFIEDNTTDLKEKIVFNFPTIALGFSPTESLHSC